VDVYTRDNGQSCINSIYSNDVACFYGDDLQKVSFNVEHSWPQSKLKEFPQSFSSTRSDLFHLYPSEVKINGARGNMPFRDCNDNSTQRTDRLSAFCDDGFQPPAVYRGLIARGMFYMSVTYSMPIDPHQEAVFRKWNKEFPVTDAERERDNRINELQGNHNPFIAHPEWVEMIRDF
jgi:endonuclease I